MMHRLLRRDLLPKSAALFLALLMWVAVINDKNPLEVRTFDFKVDMEIPQGMTMLECVPAEVSVALEGRARTLSLVNPEKLRVEVDLSGAGVGKDRYQVSFTPPAGGLRVVGVEPSTVTVDLDVSQSKQIPVLVEVRGTPHDDYTYGQPVSEVSDVMISGPKKLVDIARVVSAVVNVDKASSDVIVKPKLVVKDALGNEVPGLDVLPANVQITVPLVARPPLHNVKVTADVKGVPATGYKVKDVKVVPDVIGVRADAPVSVQSLLTQTIYVSGANASFKKTVDLIVPPGLAWIETTQVTVEVEISEDLVQREFSGVPVLPDGVLPGFTWEFKPDGLVTIVVEGRRDVIDNLDRYEIEAYVDVGGRGEGTYTLAVGPRIPRGIRLVEIRPVSVTIVLKER